jgi:hypothetical protein
MASDTGIYSRAVSAAPIQFMVLRAAASASGFCRLWRRRDIQRLSRRILPVHAGSHRRALRCGRLSPRHAIRTPPQLSPYDIRWMRRSQSDGKAVPTIDHSNHNRQIGQFLFGELASNLLIRMVGSVCLRNVGQGLGPAERSPLTLRIHRRFVPGIQQVREDKDEPPPA